VGFFVSRLRPIWRWTMTTPSESFSLRSHLHGLWLPLITPFCDGVVDETSLRRLVRHYAGLPIDGLILAATSGEGLTLGMAELEWIVAVTREALAESRRYLPICLGLAGSYTRKLCHTLDETAGWPIDGYLISSPYYSRPSQRGLLQHFTALADHASWPIVLYNIPYRSSVTLETETLLELADHPNIAGMKDCGANRAQSIELLRRRPAGFRILTGEDALYFDALADGADGRNVSRDMQAFPGRPNRRRARTLGKRVRPHAAAVCRAEPGTGQVLAGAHRPDRQRRGSFANGRGELRPRRTARCRDRAAAGSPSPPANIGLKVVIAGRPEGFDIVAAKAALEVP
jgi:hypothetical protein